MMIIFFLIAINKRLHSKPSKMMQDFFYKFFFFTNVVVKINRASHIKHQKLVNFIRILVLKAFKFGYIVSIDKNTKFEERFIVKVEPTNIERRLMLPDGHCISMTNYIESVLRKFSLYLHVI